MPPKWLQERAKGSKNGLGIPSRSAFCGLREYQLSWPPTAGRRRRRRRRRGRMRRRTRRRMQMRRMKKTRRTRRRRRNRAEEKVNRVFGGSAPVAIQEQLPCRQHRPVPVNTDPCAGCRVEGVGFDWYLQTRIIDELGCTQNYYTWQHYFAHLLHKGLAMTSKTQL